MLDTLELLQQIKFPSIKRNKLQTLQLNLGYKCNQQCVHCHVNAGPKRTEAMSAATIEQIKQFVLTNNIQTLDLTGGAPELNPNFKDLIIWATTNNIHIIDRCNLTILFEPEQEYLSDFLSEKRVEIVASMPCYLAENVDRQRGSGTFAKSIQALQLLNSKGYGKNNPNLILNLVYNPQATNLPPPQAQLQADYKQHLLENYGIEFNGLLVITNLPIARFGSALLSNNKFDDYMNLLQNSFVADNLKGLMCKYLLSVDWQGNIYDCDFNQMLKLPILANKQAVNIRDLNQNYQIVEQIIVAGHCYGCTAGQGSSCSGALQ